MIGLRIVALRRSLLILSLLDSLFACSGKSRGTGADGATSSGGEQGAKCMPGSTQLGVTFASCASTVIPRTPIVVAAWDAEEFQRPPPSC